jgi:Ca2+-transporting ATPase
MLSTPVYELRRAEVFEHLDTSPDGLTQEEAEVRRALYGRNVLAELPAAPAWRKWVSHTTHPMAILLWAAGAAAILIGRGELGLIIWIVVLINASFSFWREYRAGQAIAVLNNLLPVYARIIRSGQETKIPASDLVPGDVLVLAEGDNIPADARLIESNSLRTNNATLTGESLPALKTADPSFREDLTEIEHPNLVFAGTSVVYGTGRAVIYATGMLTQFGRIANLTQVLKEEPSLIQTQIARTTRYLVITALAIGAIVFAVGVFDENIVPAEAFILAIGILVAAMPEGLIPTVTLTLAMAVQRLAQNGVLVKKLSVVETLGSTSVICTDKSGTLTQNQMTIRKVWVAGLNLGVSGVGYEPKGEFTPSLSRLREGNGSASPEDLQALCTVAMLCNNARLVPPSPEQPRWTCLGDQTEAALRVLALKGGLDEETLTQSYPRVHELPFDARRKRMSTIHQHRGAIVAFVKGAPKEVLQLCTHIQKNGEVVPLDADTRADILVANDDYACSSLRVLAMARQEMTSRPDVYLPETVEQNMIFLGLVGMMDPPRPEVASAVQTLNSAGIRMVMITGDYGLTAESVARRLGMLKTISPRIMTGTDLDSLDDADLLNRLDEEIIFSRMAPEHKLRLVSAFQNRGEVVAVIGDGVNDTPALRKADIGIAMGITGTDVAKEAADVVLVGDNFASVVHAIEEGRAVYDNLRKFITYIFASNIPEILPFIITALFRLPLALTVPQILAIDLGTDLLPALALGVEKPEPGVMQRPPRRRTQPLVDGKLMLRAFVWLGGIEAILCYVGFFLVYYLAGYSIIINGSSIMFSGLPSGYVYILATTAFHAGVVIAQIGNAFACRTETGHVRHMGWFSNPYLLLGIAFEVILIVILIYVAPLAEVFNHMPLPLYYWLGLSLFAPLLYSLEWGRKFLTRRIKQR